MSEVPTIRLTNGIEIPQFGFGVFQIDPGETAGAVRTAFEAGYRHVDTAQSYRNEQGVGDALRESGLDRGDVFVTTKLANDRHGDAEAALDESLKRLGTDHVDLFLIHWPLPMHYGGDFVSTWKTLEEFKADGRARSIGVSNFEIAHLERILAESDTVPAVNQIEAHPYLRNDAVRTFGESRGIATEAWSPIAKGQVMDDPVIAAIADELGRTPAQVTLRWHVQRGSIVFPKSTTPARIEENMHIFDFELSADQMAQIDGLDQGEAGRTGPHPDTMSWIPG